MKHSLFLLITLLAAGCSSPENAESSSGTDSVAYDPNQTEFRGLYSTGKFISCDNPRIVYTVNDKTDLLDTLYKKALPNAYPKQTIYVEVRGSMPENRNKELLVVEEIRKAEPKTLENNCLPFDFWCRGNEPLWHAHISETENLIDIFEPQEQKSTHFEFSAPKEENGKTVYFAINETDNVKITISNEFCSDGMSERRYNFKAVVELNGRTLNGCAISPREPTQ
jgi:uncharacterized membrane protein